MIKHDGIKSRKFWLNLISQGLALGGGLICCHFPAFAPFYATYCGAIVSLCALYFTSNVAEKHVLGKHEVEMGDKSSDRK